MADAPSALVAAATLPQTLSAEVASYLGLELGKIKIKRFADGEIYVQVQVGTDTWAVCVCRVCAGD